MAINIKVGDRWAIVGASGSGKTVLSREILKAYHYATGGRVPICIIDSKIAGDFKQFEAHKSLTQVVVGNEPEKVVRNLWKKPFTIWRPDEDDSDMYDACFRGIYLSARNKGTSSITFIDELSSITNQAGKAPRYYDVLLKQGRGMNNGMISLTQSPSFVPASLLRQATHIIKMHISDDYDLKKLAKVMGSTAYEAPTDDYGFWYRNCLKPLHKSPAQYFTDFKTFVGI